MQGRPAAELDPERGRVVAQPFGDHLFVRSVQHALLRGLQPIAQALRHGFGAVAVVGGEEHARQVAVRLGIFGLRVDGGLEVLAGEQHLSPRGRKPRAEEARGCVPRVQRKGGLQLFLRVRDPALLEQHLRQDGMEVRRLRIVEQRLLQLRDRGRRIVRVPRQERVEVVPVGARAHLPVGLRGIVGRRVLGDVAAHHRGALRSRRMRASQRREREQEALHGQGAPALRLLQESRPGRGQATALACTGGAGRLIAQTQPAPSGT